MQFQRCRGWNVGLLGLFFWFVVAFHFGGGWFCMVFLFVFSLGWLVGLFVGGGRNFYLLLSEVNQNPNVITK